MTYLKLLKRIEVGVHLALFRRGDSLRNLPDIIHHEIKKILLQLEPLFSPATGRNGRAKQLFVGNVGRPLKGKFLSRPDGGDPRIHGSTIVAA